MPSLSTLETQAGSIWQWAEANLTSISTWSQVIYLGVALLLAQFLSARAARSMEAKFGSGKPLSILRIHASYHEILFLAFSVLLIWIGYLLAQAADWPFAILKIASTLATVWAIIRLTSSLIESTFWAQLIAVLLWFVAALNIFGWLDDAISIADRASMTIGTIRISVLLLIKSAIAYAILFWIVRFISALLTRGFDKVNGLTPSQRVLFNKLSNIALYVAATVIGLSIVGLDLTSLSVFSGALGLCLGFGLQKVVSNLISGIILLMDKSIKPGDVIAVDNSYGWVNSLGARCVSVLTRDGKEHLIPNENLITQTVENWSYSNRNVRLHIPIGVSYSSDIHLVKKLLLEAVSDHPRILKHPEPRCLIMGFGDSSIDHEIRAWIYDPQEGVSNVKSDILYRVWDLFKENGIEIPFPQRDVHIRSPQETIPGDGGA